MRERWIPLHDGTHLADRRERPASECLLPGDCGFCLVDAERRAGPEHIPGWGCACRRCKARRAAKERDRRRAHRDRLAAMAVAS